MEDKAIAEVGQKYILQISSDGSTYNDVGTMRSFGLTSSRGTTDVTSFDDASWAKGISALREWSVDSEAIYTYSDTAQQALWTALGSDTLYYFKLTSAADTVGVYEYSGQGWVTELTFEGETNEVTTLSVSIQGDGALTRAAITT